MENKTPQEDTLAYKLGYHDGNSGQEYNNPYAPKEGMIVSDMLSYIRYNNGYSIGRCAAGLSHIIEDGEDESEFES